MRSDLDLADMQVAIMQFTTTRITAPWLTTTTSQRIASMLNYFLEHLTGGHFCAALSQVACSSAAAGVICRASAVMRGHVHHCCMCTAAVHH